jgi:hypothetical protein
MAQSDKQEKRAVYHVRYQASNGETSGQRFYDPQAAENAAALKRAEHKRVRIVTKSVTS